MSDVAIRGTARWKRNRTYVVRVNFPSGNGAGYASDTFTCQMRDEASTDGALVAAGSVDTSNLAASDYLEVTFAYTDLVSPPDRCYFDVLRTSSGVPYAVGNGVIQVFFEDGVTAVS